MTDYFAQFFDRAIVFIAMWFFLGLIFGEVLLGPMLKIVEVTVVGLFHVFRLTIQELWRIGSRSTYK